jgi:hypothetical protein
MLSGIAELCSPGGEASGTFEVLQNFSDPGCNCSDAWYIVLADGEVLKPSARTTSLSHTYLARCSFHCCINTIVCRIYLQLRGIIEYYMSFVEVGNIKTSGTWNDTNRWGQHARSNTCRTVVSRSSNACRQLLTADQAEHQLFGIVRSVAYVLSASPQLRCPRTPPSSHLSVKVYWINGFLMGAEQTVTKWHGVALGILKRCWVSCSNLDRPYIRTVWHSISRKLYGWVSLCETLVALGYLKWIDHKIRSYSFTTVNWSEHSMVNDQ